MKRGLLNRILTGLTLATLLPIPAVTQAADAAHGLVGVWMFYAYFAGPEQPPTYVGTATFNIDGTFSGPPIDQHIGPVRGIWKNLGGGQYAFTFVSNASDASGSYVSTSRVRGVLSISADGLSASGTTMLQIFNSAGEVIASPPPNAFKGVRLTAEPF